jgi:hypothetical protein
MAPPRPLNYLTVEVFESDDGVASLEALACTSEQHHPQALAEAQALLDWAWGQRPNGHGPLDEGHEWDHDLQVQPAQGGWCSVSLTLTGPQAFLDQLLRHFQQA